MAQEMIRFLKNAKKGNLLMAGINVAVFLVCALSGNTLSSSFMYDRGACYAPAVLDGEYFRLFTSMFLHFGAVHLLFNMLCLLTMGDMLERMVGTWRYLVIYLVGGLAGNAVSVMWDVHTGRYAVSAGASGAIFAVIGAVFVWMLRHRKNVGQMRIKRVSMMVLLMVAEGFTQAGTDNAAHVGGLLMGMILGGLL